ncbi:MAG: hypothetical protein ACK4K1_02470 [Flavobacterium sp.]
MKSENIKFWVYWFALLAILFLMVSCGSKKQLLEQKTFQKSLDSVKTEKQTSKEISKEIIDSILKKIPTVNTSDKKYDSLCNLEIDRILKQLEFFKKSGSNEYKILYDQLKRQLTITGKLQESVNEISSEKINQTNLREIENRVEIPVHKPLERWQIILMTIGAVIPLGFIIWIAIYVYQIITLKS